VRGELRAGGKAHAAGSCPRVSPDGSSGERGDGVLRHALELPTAMVVITDRAGTILWVNSFFERVTGFAREEVVGANPRILKSGQTSPATYADLWGSLLAGRPWRGQFVNRRKDGTVFRESAVISPVLGPDGDITHFVAVKALVTGQLLGEDRFRGSLERCRSIHEHAPEAVMALEGGAASRRLQECNAALRQEIEERTKAEEVVRSAYRELEQIFQTAKGGMQVVDLDFNVRRANASLARIAGRPVEAMLGRKCWETFPAPCCGTERCTLERMKRGETTQGLEIEKRTADGRTILCSVDARELWDENGRLVGVVQDILDVTETRRLQSIAEAVNTSNNIGFAFSGIRHEMGNPVNAIKTTLTVLRQRLDGVERDTIAEYVDRALGDVGRMEYLLKGLRNYNMFETPELERLEIAGFFERLLPLLTPDVQRQGIQLELQCAAPGLAVRADSRALQQVLLNLVTNSVDALSGRPEPRIVLSALDAQDCAIVEVFDNGMGMSKSEVANLFKPFFTGKRGGTGLGLVIVKKTLARMSGVIEVSSVVGEGTRVRITLPKD
jgi:PAS domain S-box-containing protein